MGARPEARLYRRSQEITRRSQQIQLASVVLAQLAVAHHHQQRLAVVAYRGVDGLQGVRSGDQLLHDAFLGIRGVQANIGTDREEVVQTGVTPDRGQAEILGYTLRKRDEPPLVLAVVRFQGEDAAPAREGRHVAVSGVAVQILAALLAMQHLPRQVDDLGADGETVVLGVGGKVRVRDGDCEQVMCQWHRPAVVGTRVELGRLVVGAFLFQFGLVEQHHVAGTVVEYGGPLATDIQVHRAVAGQVHIDSLDRPGHLVEMVAMAFPVDTAVEDVHGVGVAGDCDGEASALGGVDAAGPGSHVEGVLLYGALLQVDDRHLAGLAVAHQQAARNGSWVRRRCGRGAGEQDQ